MTEKAERLYERLKAKYKNLPDFKKLDSEFEITSIKDEDITEKYFSRLVRRRIYDRFYNFNVGMLTIISPQSPSIVLAHENKFLSNTDRDLIMKVIKKFMKVEREHLILETDFDESKDAQFIASSFDVWLDVKPSVKKVLTIMRDSWGKEESFKVEDYFG